MAIKSTKKRATKSATNIWGFSPISLLRQAMQDGAKEGQRKARVHVQLAKKAAAAVRTVETADGVEIFLFPLVNTEAENDSRLKATAAVRIRDAVGASVALLEKMEIGHAEYTFELDSENLQAALLGLEIALYRFKRLFKGEPAKVGFSLRNRGKSIPESILRAATTLGVSVNLARHLVNVPPNLLNPVTYAKVVQSLFAGVKGVSVEVWDEKRLERENMNLHLGVGMGSNMPPRLVHISYKGGGAKKAPVAFVGKGITFDSGGLDVKPASGMRLMKKDMGGSAAAVAIAFWAASTGAKHSLDFYLALAENSIDGNSFRPSDVLIARNGLSVEIHNTDAEGRLVLADAMDVAVKSAVKPRFLIDIATLTGAIKVALGASLAGLFANDSKLAQSIASSSQQVGDLVWIMPLFQKYRAQLNSSFADMVNSTDGFGGAVTAALFLEKFAGDVPWAHLDIYAWKDSADGAWLESGGSGQAVLGLTNWIDNLK